MSATAEKPWTVDRFFAWQERRSERYELVNGLPLRMMAGAKNVHDDIVVNLVAELRNQLRGSGCRPFTGDGAIETIPGQIRRPDAGVDCGRRDPNGLKAATPKMVAEVLSPSTRDVDTLAKLAEYQLVETIDHILLIEPNAAEAMHWFRGEGRRWSREIVEGIDSTVALTSIGVTLKLSELYESVEFPSGPRAMRLRDPE
ncbi:MAG: Uma2 family endonuclease [Rhodospirillales bacterium]